MKTKDNYLLFKENFFNPPTNELNLTMNLDGFVRGMAEEEAMAWDENFIPDVRYDSIYF